MRGATCPPIVCVSIPVFQSTLLMRGATVVVECLTPRLRISIHAPHARSALAEKAVTPHYTFQSTLLMRGATSCPLYADFRTSFQSTLLMRGATHIPAADIHIKKQISIHAPHARSDIKIGADSSGLRKISIHAPHARSDSTGRCTPCKSRNFNPRSSCEERPDDGKKYVVAYISIHAPHARSDAESITSTVQSNKFQSTLLMRGATRREKNRG